MMRVRLIPTGQAELLGLAACLSRLFPGHIVETVPARVDPDGRRVPFDGFTSARIPQSLVPGTLKKLVEQLASEVYPGRAGEPADLAVLLDDLELDNADQPEVVVATVREAVQQHIRVLEQRMNGATVRRIEQALLERASFHLAAPMIEGWFFADPRVLTEAGVPVERLPPLLLEGMDPEAFEVADAAFSQDDGTHCRALQERNAKKRKPDRAPWMLTQRPDIPGYLRERHPKAYLSWLCRDPSHERCSTYRESQHGCRALSALNWQNILRTPAHCRFARALVQDLAEVLGPPAIPLPPGDEHPLVARSGARPGRVLRNL